jgi:hypothetical protein
VFAKAEKKSDGKLFLIQTSAKEGIGFNVLFLLKNSLTSPFRHLFQN